jgi:protein-L-isoaspartate(D-aspartate) O-methyltransferase
MKHEDRHFADLRRQMVERDLRARGIRDERVLGAMGRVPRHLFVPPLWQADAYGDHPLPIGEGQTISQPYIVALMSEALAVRPGVSVLELGTGSGYQAAILAEIGADVWTIERSPSLREAAAARLAKLGHASVRCLCGDGTLGLPGEAPFDRILATGSLPSVPEDLLRQLKEGGLFVGPVGRRAAQTLLQLTYHSTKSKRRSLGPCRFVPLVGERGWADG